MPLKKDDLGFYRAGLWGHKEERPFPHRMSQETSPSAGYRIPLIDLSFAGDLQFTVDEEPGQYLGHPTSVLLSDRKTILVVYPKGHGRGAIVMKKSADGGKTWSERLPTPDNWDTSMETPTLYAATDQQGVRRLLLFSGGFAPVRMAVSEDEGSTWTQLRPIGDYGGVVAMADLIALKDGRHMAFFHGKNRRFVGGQEDPALVSPDYLKSIGQPVRRTETKRIYKTVSDDGGLTWSEPEIAVEHPEAGICEPGLIRSPDGNQLAMLLRENTRRLNSFISFSNDEGASWSEPRQLPASLTGDRHQAVYAPDGRLFISFRDTTRESLTPGDWVAWVGTYDDMAQGREGQYRVRLKANFVAHDCAYPAVELLPDGTLVTLTYGHWDCKKDKPPYIAGLRFKIEDLDRQPKWVPQS